MAIVVSKADALLEMVRAYDSQQIKKANLIGQVLCHSIQKDGQDNLYSSYINLDRETKQYFPQKVRKNSEKIRKMRDETPMEIISIDSRYEIKIEDQKMVLYEKIETKK